MSRNLCAESCVHCGDDVVYIDEHPRLITEDERGLYKEYDGMLVMEAECPSCLAHYLAWIDDTNTPQARQYGPRPKPDYGKPYDLSYYGSFNDEPGTDKWGRFDGPQYEVQVITTRHRVRKLKKGE